MVDNISASYISISPLATELRDIFAGIECDDLVYALQKRIGRGPKGFPARSLFYAYLASYLCGYESISKTVRNLEDNPSVAFACQLEPGRIPSRPTMSRFYARLESEYEALEGVLATVTNAVRDYLPDFGRHVSVDSSVVPSWSNPDHRTDPDANYTKKEYSPQSRESSWHYGYKIHAIVDSNYELPLWSYTTSANASDSKHLIPLMEACRERYNWFRPVSVAADRGYDSLDIYRTLVVRFDCLPVIPMRKLRKGAKNRRPNSWHRTEVKRDSDEFKRLYRQRTSVERVFSRLQSTRRLNTHRFRGLSKIRLHCLLSVITMQAKALSQLRNGQPIRECVRKVA